MTYDPRDAEAQPDRELPQWQHFLSLEPCTDSPLYLSMVLMRNHWACTGGAGHGQADPPKDQPPGQVARKGILQVNHREPKFPETTTLQVPRNPNCVCGSCS